MKPISDMPLHARVWIYQCNREFTEREIDEIDFLAEKFTDSWAAHGSALSASIQVLYSRFVVIMVDENQAQASGCSIDSSVGFIRNLQERYEVNLLDRMIVAYMDGDNVATCKLDQITQLLEIGELSENTLIFNNLVRDKHEFDSKWRVPLKESWIVQYAN